MSFRNICNICGANYEYRNGRWKCPACGAFKAEELSNEEVTLLYNAAQKLRLSNFSEAEEEYEDIINKYPHNADSYWGHLLAKYGIKYEEDFDGRKIPTCYAASIESVITDKDYLKAVELADDDTRDYFIRQAEYIERVRKEWIEKACREKPYDVFICYKDSDLEKGIERTEDSVNAQEIYIHLIEQGYRVFFSRESLRDKVGEKYEPYIFNALSTSKVMLVYGSSAEYIKSTWLKNEWHRYYKKVASGDKHQESLIVACDGFSPSELPTILSSRQCLDAKRKSFFSDLDKCIKKIIRESQVASVKKTPVLFSGLHEHSYKTKVIKATCIAKGYTVHRCDCGYEYKDTYTPLVDHSFKVADRVEPTCMKGGYEKSVCEICGESKTISFSALEHQFTRWIETKHPSCAEDGITQRQCVHCGCSESKPIPQTGHEYSMWSSSVDGIQTRYCVNCGHTQTRERVLQSPKTAEVTSKNIAQNTASTGVANSMPQFFDVKPSVSPTQNKKTKKKKRTDKKLRMTFWEASWLFFTLLLIVGLGLGLYGAADYYIITPENQYREAMGFIEEGQYEPAYEIYEEISKRHPNGNYTKALEEALKALSEQSQQ